MQRKFSSVFAAIIMVVLLALAVGWGAQKGWTHEREAVEKTLVSLENMLAARAEVAANVLTVAKRHLPETDAGVLALAADRAALQSGSLAERAAANERLTEDARALLTALAALGSVQSDERDSMYVGQMLPQALEQSLERTAQAQYNQEARSYNERFARGLSGALARLMGVKEAEEFIAK